jgi:hypothetical protein
MSDLINTALRQDFEETEVAQKELFCKDFDISCFELNDPSGCKRGKTTLINSIFYFTVPVAAVCPISDDL